MKCAALALLAGCHLAFGLQHQDPQPDAPDAPPPLAPIQGRVDFVQVSNDAAFSPVETSRFYTTFELAIYVVSPDGEMPIEYHADTGTFAIPRTGDRQRIQFRFGHTIVEYQWDAPELDVHQLAFGRVGAPQATATTTLSGALASTLPTQGTVAYATGIWSAVTVSFDGMGDFTGAWHGALASTTAHDRMFIAGYDLSPQGYLVLDRVATIPQIEMTTSNTPLGNVSLVAAAATGCAHAVANVAANAARLDALYPSFGASAAAGTMDVYALADAAREPLGPWTLAHTGSGVGDAMIPYAEVFPGMTPLLASSADRASKLPDGSPIGIETVSFQRIDDPTCGTAIPIAPHDIALASNFTLAGQDLQDNVVVTLPPAPTLGVAWEPNGRADMFVLQILDVTGTTTAVAHTYGTTVPSATLDRSDFVSGHHYVFIVYGDLGLPGIAMGDLTARSYPTQESTAVSPIFTVQ